MKALNTTMNIEIVDLIDLKPYARNAKKHSESQIAKVAGSIARFGWQQPIVIDKDNIIIIGHCRYEAAKLLGFKDAPCKREADLTEEEIIALRIADNKLNESEWDEALAMEDLAGLPDDLKELTGWESLDDDMKTGKREPPTGHLTDKYIVPPFSVLDTRQGYWRQRRKEWLATGIKSELGRPDCGMMKFGFNNKEEQYGKVYNQTISIFDPVLTEVCYSWFNVNGGSILDPFAGGSVRGVVAAKLGYKYTGIELREEQVRANIENAREILADDQMPTWITGDSNVILNNIEDAIKEQFQSEEDMPLTPIEKHSGLLPDEPKNYWVKREDDFAIFGACGAKARAAYVLLRQAKRNGFKEVTTAGSRKSPQINIAAKICKGLGLQLRAHCPTGELGPELEEAKHLGAWIIQHKAGYNNVIIARAREEAEQRGAYNLPFGMATETAVSLTFDQFRHGGDIPKGVKRILVPVGSGVNLAGILRGVKELSKSTGHIIPVVGIVVGAEPTDVLDKYAPPDWKDYCRLINSTHDYHTEVKASLTGMEDRPNITLDPIYEAKCRQYLQENDLFWIVGLRSSECNEFVGGQGYCNTGEAEDEIATAKAGFDMVFSCPPYMDLEVYSDDPADLSNMLDEGFNLAYKSIIKKAVDKLKNDRFAVFVVSEVRDPKSKGLYRGFVPFTIECFEEAGAHFYNELILVNVAGSAIFRAARAFSTARKMVRLHQNVLVFYKGDVANIKANYLELQIPDLKQFIDPEDLTEGEELAMPADEPLKEEVA